MNYSSRIYCHLPFVAMTSTLLLLPSAGTTWANQFQYSLVNDWSNTQNPSGAWSYNYNNSPISVYQTFWWGQAGWGNLWIGDGCIIKGSQPIGTDPWGNPSGPSHDWLPGDVMMHALSIPYGGDTTFLNVTWTSPADGMIDITGRAWDGEILSDRDVAWSLLLNGQTIAQRSSVFGLYRTDAGAQFASNLVGNNSLTGIPVTQGEVLEFRVATDTYYGQFVGIQENITLTTVPEAGTFPLFVAGIVGLGLGRRFSSKKRSVPGRASPR
jgi:hypothetical protein